MEANNHRRAGQAPDSEEQEFSAWEGGGRGSQGRGLCWPVAWNAETFPESCTFQVSQHGWAALAGPISSLQKFGAAQIIFQALSPRNFP